MNHEPAMRYVRVVIDRAIHRELDYSVPESLAGRVGIGSRVRVPFREKSALATVVAVPEQSEAKGIRPIEAIVGEAPILSEHVLELARWIGTYYCCPIETVVRSVLPQVIRHAKVGWKKQLFVQPGQKIDQPEIEKLRKRAPRQAELLEAISKLDRPIRATELLRQTSLDNQTLRALVKRGLAELREEAVVRDPHADEQFIATSNLVLNEEQTGALKEIIQALNTPDNMRPILLHGVTGSGKTEIYLQAIRTAIDRGRTAIVLVPEISLTPQTVERFKGRFAEAQDTVAVLHSHLSEGERHDEWHKIHSGRAQIVIGARSAVFAPLKNLGLIVVDEEHETTYKQEEAPRYHARDVAVVRAKIEKCVVVLGSATPSLESYHNAASGKYRLVTLTQRVDQKQMPLMRVVDLRQERRKGKKAAILSEKLSQAIADRLEKREQTILFLNRRGFSTSSALQQLRRSTRLPELQRCAYLSPAAGSRRTIELSLVRAHRRRSEKMSGLRKRRADLSRVRHGESGIDRRADFSESRGAPHGRRLHDAQGSVSRNVAEFSHRQDRHPGRHTNDRERSAFSKRDAGRHHQRRSCFASARFPRRRTNVPTSHTGRRTGRPWRNGGRSFCANLHSVFAVDPVCAPPRFRRLFPTGTRVSRTLRFPAVQTRNSDHASALRTKVAQNSQPRH